MLSSTSRWFMLSLTGRWYLLSSTSRWFMLSLTGRWFSATGISRAWWARVSRCVHLYVAVTLGVYVDNVIKTRLGGSSMQ